MRTSLICVLCKVAARVPIFFGYTFDRDTWMGATNLEEERSEWENESRRKCVSVQFFLHLFLVCRLCFTAYLCVERDDVVAIRDIFGRNGQPAIRSRPALIWFLVYICNTITQKPPPRSIGIIMLHHVLKAQPRHIYMSPRIYAI